NPVQPSNGGGMDAFVSKLDPTGQTLLYTTYLGGTGDDIARAIAVDTDGNACIAGSTQSANYPMRNAKQSTNNRDTSVSASTNAFVSKVSADGTVLNYSTYLGGSGGADSVEFGDVAYGIAVDSTGKIYVTGNTFSSGTNAFPTKNALQSTNNGGSDTFLAK